MPRCSIELLDTHELAWAAGLFDGEGSTYATQRERPDRPRTNMVVRMAVSMTDFASVRRFHRAVGMIGEVVGPYQERRPNRLPQIRWQSNNFENTQATIALLWRWLGPAKREQARICLTEHQAYQEKLRPYRKTRQKKLICKHGHNLSVTRYTAPGGGSYCRACNNSLRRSSTWRKNTDAPLFNALEVPA